MNSTAPPVQAEEKMTVLVVDDIPTHLAIISEMLSSRFRCRVATRGDRALELASACPRPDLILLDVILPDINGYEVCRRLKSNPETRNIPIIFLTSLDSTEDESRGFAEGGVDYITKPVSKGVLNARVDAQASLLRTRRLLEEKGSHLKKIARQRTEELQTMQDAAVMAMSFLAESVESQGRAHSRRIQLFSRELALALRETPRYRELLDDDALELLYRTSPLRDIGKINVPSSILSKQGRLSEAEFETVKQHALLGGKTFQEMEHRFGMPERFLTMAGEIAMYHHERWDGTGYPMGLKGEDIPLCARIVALADTYDALTSRRIYKPPYPPGDAAIIISRERERQFDPVVVEAFLAREQSFRNIAATYADDSYMNAKQAGPGTLKNTGSFH